MVPETLLLTSVAVWLSLTAVGVVLLLRRPPRRTDDPPHESTHERQWRYEASQFDDD